MHNVRMLHFKQRLHLRASDKKRNYCLASVVKLFLKLIQVYFLAPKLSVITKIIFPLASINLPNNLACIDFHRNCSRKSSCWHNTFWSLSPKMSLSWNVTLPCLSWPITGFLAAHCFEKPPRIQNKTIVYHFLLLTVLKATHVHLSSHRIWMPTIRSLGHVKLTRKMSAKVPGNLFISSYF